MAKWKGKGAVAPQRKRTGGQRIHQEKIDNMVSLRIQGFGYAEIAGRVGCSVRTVQRYVKRVKPQLHIPDSAEQPNADVGSVRRRLLKKFVEELFNDHALQQLTMTWVRTGHDSYDVVYGGPISTRFLIEAERLFRDALQAMGTEMLQLVGGDPTTQERFVRDVIGELRTDYERWLWTKQNFGGGHNETGEDWRPRRERSVEESREVDNLWRLHGEY